MECSDEKLKDYSRRILVARMKLLCDNPFYGLLLMHIKFSLTDRVKLCAFGGDTILFNPEFLDAANDDELEFAMKHEILHIALRHDRRAGSFSPERFNIACDIVVNSNILKSSGGDMNSITLSMNGGVQRHTAPDGSEGAEHTAEELYELIPEPDGDPIKGPGSRAEGDDGPTAEIDSDVSDPSDSQGSDEEDKEDEENEKGGGDSDGGGSVKKKVRGKAGGKGNGDGQSEGEAERGGFDDHLEEETEDDENKERAKWMKRIVDAAGAVMIRDPSNSRGLIPAFAERMLRELRNPQIDWRQILAEFVEEEICDYSFSPPDRRFDDSPFFLPDFNDTETTVKNILFMIDTSGSMSDEMMTAAYSEIKGAIDQFGGKLAGWLGFFDATVYPPEPFTDEDEFRIIRLRGGGGTDFEIIFDYVRDEMEDDPPASIIILTDGYAPFPKEELANGIPVLWLINNEHVTPPWGKIARISV